MEKKFIDQPLSIYWDEKFPGKGEALASMLGPLACKGIYLKPILPDFEERARRAIFWRDVARVRHFRWSEMELLMEARSDAFWSGYLLSLSIHHQEILHAWQRTSFSDPLYVGLSETMGSWIGSMVMTPLWNSIWYACSFILSQELEEAAKYSPIHELWLTGNIPIGFDKEGNLLVLVADEAT